MKIVLGMCIILMVIAILGAITTANNKLYCRFYLRKEWKLWEDVCKNLDNAVFVSKYIDSYASNYKFSLDLNGKTYNIIYWIDEGTVSVHDDIDCILSTFDSYHTNIAADKILDKISELHV